MKYLLYILAVILLIGWIIGVFFYMVGGFIHILIVLAVVSILFKVIEKR